MADIMFAGRGHGAVAALRSLQGTFGSIEIVTDDDNIRALLRARDSIIAHFLSSSTKLVVCAGYQKLIARDILQNKTIINTHPSLLPKYRGLHSVVWAMLNGEQEHGFTVHLMNEAMDDGDILFQYRIHYENQTSKEIMDLFDTFVRQHLGSIVSDFVRGKIAPIKQDRGKATWVAKRNLEDCLVDFQMPNWRVKALFRALVEPYPLPRMRVREKVYEIVESEVLEANYYCQVGRVVNVEGANAYIKLKEGVLVVNRLRDVDSQILVEAKDVLMCGQRL